MNVLPYKVYKLKTTNGVIITFVDITLRISDLKEQERLIIEHELLLDTLSHDIKTPLTGLKLTIDLLTKVTEKGMEKFPFLLSKVENSMKKIQHVIDELTASRWHKHKYQAVPELLDFEHIIEDKAHSCRTD
jgi:two-component system phosphate regulon sensor histidine kinase PhoR